MLKNKKWTTLAWTALLIQVAAHAEAEEEVWNAKFQATYIWPAKRSFSAAYSGPNSLATAKEKSYSFTATAALGFLPWTHGELYFDPEVSQGVPLSNLAGLGGFTNGDMARTSGPNPTFYRAPLFLRQTWGFGGEEAAVESDANQLAGDVDKRRLVFTAGNLSVLDLFDDNTFSHDPGTQRINNPAYNRGSRAGNPWRRPDTRGILRSGEQHEL